LNGFEIYINNKKVCTASIGDDGVLSSILTLAKRSHKKVDGVERKLPKEELYIEVGAYMTKSNSQSEHVKWLNQELNLGDLIQIKIIDTQEPDTPTERRPENPKDIEVKERAYYEKLKKKFES